MQERWFAALYLLKPFGFTIFSLFWISTGIISLTVGFQTGLSLLHEARLDRFAPAIVISGALLDIAIGGAIAVRSSTRQGLYAAACVTVSYAAAGSLLIPRLWADPLAPLLKIFPLLVLNSGVARHSGRALMLYLQLKYLHIIGATVLLGTGAGIAFFMLLAHRTGEARVVAAVARIVVIADFVFTASAVLLQPVSGAWLARYAGYSILLGMDRLVVTSLSALTGAFWLPVVWMQMRMRDLAEAAARTSAPICRRQYHSVISPVVRVRLSCVRGRAGDSLAHGRKADVERNLRPGTGRLRESRGEARNDVRRKVGNCMLAVFAPLLVNSGADRRRIRNGRLRPVAYKACASARSTRSQPANAGRLGLAFTFDTGLKHGEESATLVVGGTMYFVTPFPNTLYALDLTKPGAPVKWKFDPHPDPASQGVACCDSVNRGPAYGDGKIVFNTLDGQTIAVDAATGKAAVARASGQYPHRRDHHHGAADRQGQSAGRKFRRRVRRARLAGGAEPEGWQHGLEGLEHRARQGRADRPGLPSLLRHGPRQGSGRQDLACRPVEEGRRQCLGLGHLRSRPATWSITAPAIPARGIPTSGPATTNGPSGVFARDLDTGQARWFYQWSPHDLYDHDGINENILVDRDWKGQPRKLLLHPGRNGYMYVLDRTTGQVLSAKPFVYINSSKGVDLKTGG